MLAFPNVSPPAIGKPGKFELNEDNVVKLVYIAHWVMATCDVGFDEKVYHEYYYTQLIDKGFIVQNNARVTYVCSGIASSTSFGKADLEIEHQCIVEFKAKNIALKDVLPQLNKYVRTKKYMRDKNITGGIVVAEEVAKYRQDVPKGTHLVGDIWGIIINFYQKRSEIHFWVPGYTRDTMILPVQFGEYLTLEQVSAIVRPMLRPMTVPFVPQPTGQSTEAKQTVLSTFFTRDTAENAVTLNLNATATDHHLKRAPMLPLHRRKSIDVATLNLDASANAESCDKRAPMPPVHQRKCTYEKCPNPYVSSQFYRPNPYNTTGRHKAPRDWASLSHMVLCNACLNQFWKTGSLERRKFPNRKTSRPCKGLRSFKKKKRVESV